MIWVKFLSIRDSPLLLSLILILSYMPVTSLVTNTNKVENKYLLP